MLTKLLVYILIFVSLILGQLPFILNQNESYIEQFSASVSGEYLLNVTASSNTNWSEENNESSILTVFVDEEYNQDIVMYNGNHNHTYKQSIGFISEGEHTIEFLFDYNKSSNNSSYINLSNIETIESQLLNAPYKVFEYSPIIYGRNIFEWNESSYTDIPLILFYDLNSWHDSNLGNLTSITYHIIFSNEDSRVGIGLSDMMLSWGRTTDIEWVYEIILDENNEIISEIFQGASHTPTAFAGEKYYNHPILINATPNCNFDDNGISDYKFFLSPNNIPSDEHTREYLMDMNPWIYKIMGEELINEDKYEDIQDPTHWELSDVRNYLFVEYTGTTSGSNIACTIKATFYNDCYKYSNNHNDTEILAGFANGVQRTAIELPENFDVDDLQYLHFNSTGNPEYSITLNEIKAIFYLSDTYAPTEIDFETINNPITLNTSFPNTSIVLNEETLEFDCTETFDGEALCDECNICTGGNTGISSNEDFDDCGVCFGQNQNMDCNGVCFGNSYVDDCYVCDENSSNDNETCNAGCFDVNAENYDSEATIFNNSCIYSDRTFHVPGEYEKIEYAIFFASNEDTVLVEPGIYYEELHFQEKSIKLLSTDGPETTIIIANADNGDSGGVLDLGSSVITVRDVISATIDGFTLENGYGKGVDFEYFISLAADEDEFNMMLYNYIESGGLSVINSSITLSNMIIKNNTALNVGGGIGLVNSNTLLSNVVIENNTVENVDGLGGGGIGINGGTTIINDCIIRNNTVGTNIYQLNGGGAIMCGFNFGDTPLELYISNTQMYGNTANIGAAIGALSGNIHLDKNLIYDNSGDYGSAISLGEPLGLVIDDISMIITNSTLANNHGSISLGMIDNSNIIIANSIIWNNGIFELASLPNNSILNTTIFNSNIRIIETLNYQNSLSIDPLFSDYENNIFQLLNQSPCIDMGTNLLILNDNIILNMQQDEYSGIMPDIGYFEFISAIVGDINQDNHVNIYDIVILVEYAMLDIYFESGDLNQDESINIIDVIILVNLILTIG